MGHFNFDYGRKKAENLYDRSLALYRVVDDPWGIANALSALSWANWSGGAYEEANNLFKESFAMRQSLGDQRGIVDSLSGLGNCASFRGQFEEAERLFRESRAILQQIVAIDETSNGILNSEREITAVVENGRVRVWYRENVGLYSDLGYSHSLAPSNSILGFSLKHQGKYEQARQQGETGLALAQQAGWRQEEGLCLELLGEVALAEGAYIEARSYLSESVAVLRRTRQLELSEAIAVLGYAVRGAGQLSQAMAHLVEALRTASEIGTMFPMVTALPGVAVLLADKGEEERAVELYALALRHPRVANSRWFEDIAGKHIAAMSENLPPDVVAEARTRGRKLDLEDIVMQLLFELENFM